MRWQAHRLFLLADLGRAAPCARGQAAGARRQLDQAFQRRTQLTLIAESGLPGFDYNLVLLVRAGRHARRHRREDQPRRLLRAARAEVQVRMTALGAEAMPMSAAEFDKFMRVEMDDAAKVVKAAGIKLQ